MASNASLVLLESRLKKTRLTRSSKRPLRSRASIVLAKSGGSAQPAIVAISASCAAIPSSKAGGKCSGRMRSNGGRPNGVVQSSKNGFSLIRCSPRLAAALGVANGRSFTRCPLLGLVLVEHRFGRGIALGAELGAVVAAPLIGGGARRVGTAEMRHHIARVKLVGPLGRLEVRPIVRLLQERAEYALLLFQ